MQTPRRTSVVILNSNGLHDTLECIASVKRSQYPALNLVVVDNGSTDGSAGQIARRFPDVAIIRHDDNIGHAEGLNSGMRLAIEQQAAEVVVILDNESRVSPAWLQVFSLAADKLPPGSVLGGRILSFDKPGVIWHFGARWSEAECEFEVLGRGAEAMQFKDITPVDQIFGGCMWIPVPTLEKVGMFETEYFSYYEDADWCSRARRKGVSLYSVPGADISYKVSRAQKAKAHSGYFSYRNRLLWIERNFDGADRKRVLRKVAFPDQSSLRRRYLANRLQQIVYALFGIRMSRRNMTRLAWQKAALAGIKDFRKRRFGPGPEWIRQDPSDIV